jgi:methyl-accepting chemotaxis protein
MAACTPAIRTPRATARRPTDIPAAGLEAVRQGKPYEYEDAAGLVHLLQPLRLHADIAPWAVQLSFPQSVATASPAKLLREYRWSAALLCALLAAAVMVVVLNRLMRPLRALAATMTSLASGNADLTVRLAVAGKDELAAIAAASIPSWAGSTRAAQGAPQLRQCGFGQP